MLLFRNINKIDVKNALGEEMRERERKGRGGGERDKEVRSQLRE